MRVQKRTAAILFTILIVVLIPLAWQRHRVDQGSPDVALFVEGNELLLRSSERGVPLSSYLEALVEVGVTAVGVPVTTLNDLQQRGDIAILTGRDSLPFLPEGAELSDKYETVVICRGHDSMPRVLQALDTASISYLVPDSETVIVQASPTMVLRSAIGFDPVLLEASRRHGLDIILVFWPFIGSTAEYIVDEISKHNPLGIVFSGTRIADIQDNLRPLAEAIRDRDITIFRIQDQITLRGYANTDGVMSLIGNDTQVIRTGRFSRAETNNSRFTSEILTEKWITYVREYNVRGLYVNPLFAEDDIGANQDYFRGIIHGLTSRGYKVSSVASAYPRWYPSPMIQGLLGLAVSLFMLSFLPYRRVSIFLLYVVAVLVLFILNMTQLRATTNAVWSLGMAILASFVFLSAFRSSRHPIAAYLLVIILTTVSAVGIALLMSDYNAVMEYTFFRGVKIQYLLPMVMMGIVLWRDQFNLQGLRRLLKVRLSVPQIFLAVVLSIFLGLYVLRSGNVDTIPSIELQARLMMDRILQVRPRFKELAGNSLILFALLYRSQLNRQVRNLILLLATIAPISIVNSLMHFRTPIAISLLRVFHAAWMGLVMGFALFLLAKLLEKATLGLTRVWSSVSGEVDGQA